MIKKKKKKSINGSFLVKYLIVLEGCDRCNYRNVIIRCYALHSVNSGNTRINLWFWYFCYSFLTKHLTYVCTAFLIFNTAFCTATL